MDPISIGIEEAAGLSGIGIVQLREYARTDSSFPAFSVGRAKKKIIIPVAEFTRWLNERGRLRVGLKTQSSAVAQIIDRKRRERKAT